jgi:hypothetical protein
MFHKIKNQRQHLESCLNTRGIESKMMIFRLQPQHIQEVNNV